MEYALVGILAVFLVFLFVETRSKSRRIKAAVIDVKRGIAEDSSMTASIGVFTPDTQTTVVIGVSEQLGSFYYRMLRQAKTIIKSRINLANLAKIELLINGKPHVIEAHSEQLTTSLCATDIADQTLSDIPPDSIRQIERTAMRIIFYDEAGLEKTLEITTYRSSDERQRFDRVSLIKNTVWWVAFLQIASRAARRTRSSVEEVQKEEAKSE